MQNAFIDPRSGQRSNQAASLRLLPPRLGPSQNCWNSNGEHVKANRSSQHASRPRPRRGATGGDGWERGSAQLALSIATDRFGSSLRYCFSFR